MYYVHYVDFNKRLDEWVAADRLDISVESKIIYPKPEDKKDIMVKAFYFSFDDYYFQILNSKKKKKKKKEKKRKFEEEDAKANELKREESVDSPQENGQLTFEQDLQRFFSSSKF